MGPPDHNHNPSGRWGGACHIPQPARGEAAGSSGDGERVDVGEHRGVEQQEVRPRAGLEHDSEAAADRVEQPEHRSRGRRLRVGAEGPAALPSGWGGGPPNRKLGPTDRPERGVR